MPKTIPSAVVMTPAIGMLISGGTPCSVPSQAEANAPKPKNALWPSDIWPGEPDQHVEPQRGDAVDADQDELAQNVIAGEQRQREQKRDAGAGHDHRSPGPEHGHVCGVAGAEVAAGPGIGNVGQWASARPFRV